MGQKQVYSCECANSVYSSIIIIIIVLFSLQATVNLLLPHPVYVFMFNSLAKKIHYSFMSIYFCLDFFVWGNCSLV